MIDCGCADFQGESFNTLTLGDFNGGSDTEGRLFVCGDANLTAYSVGSVLPEDTNRDDLFVGGNLDFSSGRVHSGNIVYGVDAQIPDNVVMGMFNRSIRQDPFRFDCFAAIAWFSHVSDGLATLLPTGSASLEAGKVLLLDKTSLGSPTVFNVNCEDLEEVRYIKFAGLSSSMDVIINMFGSTCDIAAVNIVAPNPEKVLFNFPEAETLVIRNTDVQGTVFAPYADVSGTGVINGVTVAKNFNSRIQQNNGACGVCLPADITNQAFVEVDEKRVPRSQKGKLAPSV